MATKKKPSKNCKPKFDDSMLESCDGTHYDDGRPCVKCTKDKWPSDRLGANPCCPGAKPIPRSEVPEWTDDQYGRYLDMWNEYADQYCPIYNPPPKPPGDPKPPVGPKPPSGPPILPPGHVDPDAEVSTRPVMLPPKEVAVPDLGLYPDHVPEPYGTGNWRM